MHSETGRTTNHLKRNISRKYVNKESRLSSSIHSLFPYINHAAHRDHRKIAVIDGKVAYTGGMNIADYYINGLPKIGTWRDMHTRIEGDAVNDLQEIFLTIWNKGNQAECRWSQLSNMRNKRTVRNIVVAIVDRTRKKNSRMLSHAYAMSIYSTKKKECSYRQSLFCTDFFYQKGVESDNRPRRKCYNHGFFCLRYPVYSGCRTL